MSLTNCEVNLILNWSENSFIVFTNVVNQATTFTISETKLYVPVVTLPTEDNAKVLTQLKSGFKGTSNWKKHLLKPKLLTQNSNLNHLVKAFFQGINRLFLFAFGNDTHKTTSKIYYLPNVETKNYNFMIAGKHFFD